MDNQEKEEILNSSREHVARAVKRIEKFTENLQASLKKSEQEFKLLSNSDRVSERALINMRTKRLDQVEKLVASPYFSRCDVIWSGKSHVESIYFSLFSFDAEYIYSWASPSSSMRFEKLGPVEYERPDGRMQRADLVRKDQYMITSKKITFLSVSIDENGDQLVYQEHFSNRKKGFVLPEIVAQMEKAQDLVIRAHHKGSFLISGPAGSGKTTLALHRVAYLASRPDIADTYEPRNIIIFVQDSSSKEYFSHLLPTLGIQGVHIITFSEWVLTSMGLSDKYKAYSDNIIFQDEYYIYTKVQALKSFCLSHQHKGGIYQILNDVYSEYFDRGFMEILKEQKREGFLDHIDLTVLAHHHAVKNEGMGRIQEYWDELNSGKFRKRRGYVKYSYALALVDEFQNYLPEQLSLIRSCVNPRNISMIYVGDMAQQVRPGTIREWSDIGENLQDDRVVVVQKIYRNTKNILLYIQKLGYDIEVPGALREGDLVEEVIRDTSDDEILFVENKMKEEKYESVGIITKNIPYLEIFDRHFMLNDKVHVMSMIQSQGLEFDIVFIVGVQSCVQENIYPVGASEKFQREKAKIDRDLLYVALTRAIKKMYILGKATLKDSMK